MTTKIVNGICALTALGLVFIGLRFFLAPVPAETDYGLKLDTHGDFSFHYIKGARDLFSGLLILLLLMFKERRALGIALLAATIVPLADMLIVMSKPYNVFSQVIPHLIAVLIALIAGFLLLFAKKSRPNESREQAYIKFLRRADKHGETVVESNVLPGDKTPLHYHTLFDETFEVLAGRLEVGKGKAVFHLQAGDTVTIDRNEPHYFNNKYEEACVLRTTLRPGNKAFENAGLILKGLQADGLTNSSGLPKKLSDLALFVYLNNSKMLGPLKLVEPVLQLLVKRAIKNGRLAKLQKDYCH